MRKLLDTCAQCTFILTFANEIANRKLKGDLLMIGDIVMQF